MTKRVATVLCCLLAFSVLPAAAPAANPFGSPEKKEDKPAGTKAEKGGNPFGGAEKPDKPQKAEGKPAPAPGGRKEKGEFGQGAVFGEQDVASLAEKLALDDEQKDKLTKLKEMRDKATERFDRTYAKRVAQAQERLQKLLGANDKDYRVAQAKRELMTFLKSVETNRANLTDQFDRRMFALLKPEQRARWNSPILRDALNKEFGFLILTPEQEEKLTKLCDAQARRVAIPLDPEKHAKSIQGLYGMVYKSILTTAQRNEYRKAKISEQRAKAQQQKRR